ncbi:CAP domain-containing protein [Lentibacillus sp. L22]|uniref:CAP domain-containing protein n=1 Tax=Lentibacillus TaxID=175304 RepID=UPI0022B0F9FF|nr:CAP domain-containing protein [Lentibacillus daqui]
MWKKFGIATAITTALVFGGALSSVDASAGTDHSTNQTYTVNGSHNLLNNYLNHCHINSNQQGDNQKQQADQPKQDQPQQTENEDQAQQTEQQPAQTENSEAPADKPAADKQESKDDGQAQGLSQFEQQVVDLTNQERQKQGLSPLKADTELSKVAHEKSRDMSANNYFSHNSPNYGSPFDMMKSYGISYKTAGENIAKGQKSPEEVVNGWMNSEGHRANILNPDFTHIGVGHVENGNYWTQEFIGK